MPINENKKEKNNYANEHMLAQRQAMKVSNFAFKLYSFKILRYFGTFEYFTVFF